MDTRRDETDRDGQGAASGGPADPHAGALERIRQALETATGRGATPDQLLIARRLLESGMGVEEILEGFRALVAADVLAAYAELMPAPTRFKSGRRRRVPR